MKLVRSLFAVGAIGVVLEFGANAHPHKIKRDLVTEVTFTTVTVANVIVWVDDNGAPYSTETVDALATTVDPTTETPTSGPVVTPLAVPTSFTPSSSSETPVTTPAPVPSSSTVVVSTDSASKVVYSTPPIASAVSSSTSVSSAALVPVYSAIPISSSALVSTSPTAAAPSVAAANPPTQSNPHTSSGGFHLGVAWDAYTESNGANGCKSESQVADEFSAMASFKIVRTYGIDCSQVDRAVKHALANGQQLLLGFYMPNDTPAQAVQVFSNAIKQHADGNWGVVAAVTVENEGVLSKRMTASEVVNGINQARNLLKQAGYNGPVGAVETAPSLIDNPQVCEASDFAFANIHPFFDTNTVAADAGSFVQGQIAQIEKACPNKRVVVMESGWPYQGQAHGKAVPSRANQKAALESLRNAFTQDLVLFSGFDSTWKAASADTFYTEQYWGFLDN
ncbi:glycoside hydrolase superfamily [Clohesyomyces aquaticus]|uniref:Glycoside hydrolase superfamily n=1 Tax=Clohesyomyces aquaticus TaxID=1231657 RepID=A0A1Y2A023_9PLEO|nr:glycoside hydrolase superfamily [Clohesyomyces aquaticus]